VDFEKVAQPPLENRTPNCSVKRCVFSLFAGTPKRCGDDVEAQVYTCRFAKSFCDWVSSRLAEVENGDADPLFLRAENFVVSQVN
jgi:hypothetical protein